MARKLEAYFSEVTAILSESSQLQERSTPNASFLDAIYQYIQPDVKSEDKELVVAKKLLSLLTGIDNASQEDQKTFPGTFSIALGDMKTLNALLELIVIECIFPYVSTGVGIPLGKRIKNRHHIAYKVALRTDILRQTVDCLLSIVASEDDIADVIMGGQFCTDIISSTGELAFNPVYQSEQFRDDYKYKFTDFLGRLETYTLLTYITTLIQKDTPTWFIKILTRTLAMVPLTRPNDGVQSLIEFIGGLREDDSISVDKLERAARVLISVPFQVESRRYFEAVADQLLRVLDAVKKNSLVGSTVQIITIMHAKNLNMVTDFIFKPLITALNPEISESASELVLPDKQLAITLSRISSIIRNSPPDIVLELLKPVYLSLWRLIGFQKQTKRSIEQTKSLLLVYIKTHADSASVMFELTQTVHNESGKTFEFANGVDGGVEIRRFKPVFRDLGHEIDSIGQIEQQSEIILDIVKELDKTSVRNLFLKCFRQWLNDRNDNEADPFLVFGSLRLLEGILESRKSEIIESPSEIIQLVSEIIDEYVSILETKRLKLSTVASQIENIAQQIDDEDNDSDDENDEELEHEISIETLSVAISLLSAIVSESMLDSSLTENDHRILKSLGPRLKLIAQNGAPRVSSAAGTLAVLLDETDISTANSMARLNSSQGQYQQALTDLQDPLIPIRAHGLHVIRALIETRDPIINVDNVLKIYLSTLNDEDSFIYLNSIKGLQALTNIHGIRVIQKLIYQYTLPGKKPNFDERLRIGEAILRTIQRLGEALSGDNAEAIVLPMITVVVNRKLDIRIRTSAMSILGMACEVNPIGLSGRLEDCIDCALGILTFETREDAIIIRRAAMVLIGSLLKGIGTLNNVPKEFAKKIVRTIRYSKASDKDALVRVQSQNVLDILGDFLSDELSLK
ncbi:hypothetical protein V1514DRAFT_288056 [Lipomyces japonicus]|uniref:uncharacterized protein n=1 Tax=Lipomyces japonicus TaxID=56871 RepID=UPI0034CD58F5